LGLIAIDGRQGDNYGGAIAVSQELIAVGAPLRVSAPTTVSLYSADSKSQAVKLIRVLTAPDLSKTDGYGGALALTRSLLFCGAPLYATRNRGGSNVLLNAGTVYVYRVNGRAETSSEAASFLAQLQVKQPVANAAFGYALAADEQLGVLVGAPGDKEKEMTGAGSASLFVVDASKGVVSELMRLVAPDAKTDDGFGYAVALRDGLAVVGSPGVDDASAGVDVGAAYVFHIAIAFNGKASVTFVAKLVSAFAHANSFFGASLAVDGDVVIVGEPGADGDNGKVTNTGSAQVFTIDVAQSGTARAAKHVQTLAPTGDVIRSGDPRFGISMATDGHQLIVGAPGIFKGIGAAYVFEAEVEDGVTVGYTLWGELRTPAYVPQPDDNLGFSVALDPEGSGIAVAGAPGVDLLDILDSGVVLVTICGGGEEEEEEEEEDEDTESTTAQAGPADCAAGEGGEATSSLKLLNVGEWAVSGGPIRWTRSPIPISSDLYARLLSLLVIGSYHSGDTCIPCQEGTYQPEVRFWGRAAFLGCPPFVQQGSECVL
jgi:hypothetical protein